MSDIHCKTDEFPSVIRLVAALELSDYHLSLNSNYAYPKQEKARE